MVKTTRRQALVTMVAGLSANPSGAQEPYSPATFSEDEYEMLGALVDMILPATETPGAREVGVHSMLDEDLADGGDALAVLRAGLASLSEEGFDGLTGSQRVEVLTRYSEGSGPEREFFDTLKGLTIDAYYSTEVGLVDELGYQGNTYLTEFPGCTDDHLLDEAL